MLKTKRVCVRARKAVLDVAEKNDTRGWEREFGVSGAWWARRGGADHILVQAIYA